MFLHSLRLLKRPLLRSGPRLFRYLTSLPETKDASSIIPILNTIEEKSASSYNDLLKQLALNGRSEQAQTVYDEIFRNHVIKANVDTFSHLMVAYMNDGKYHDSMEIYHELRNYEDRASSLDLRLDSSVYETMIESLTKARPDYKRFEQDQEPIYEYSVADNDSLIVTNVEGDSSPSLLTALTLLNDMRHLEIPATVNIYTSMLQACAEQKDEYVLEKVHRLIRMEPCIDPEIDITNHLLKAYYEIKDIGLVLDIWNVAEETKGFDQTSISVVLKACIESGNLERANHIWSLMEDNMKIQKEDYNRYLDCLLRYGIIEQAKILLQEGMAKGIADKTSRLGGRATGTGRTTFVNTLCDSNVLSKKICDNPEDAHHEPGINIKPVSIELDEDGVRISLTIVDTPGFGDNIDNERCFKEIVGYLERQYDDILAEESRIKRNPRFRDNRVHALLYFISPTGHALREIDIELMRRLSPRVNVIPVIGRADSFTPQELRDFKKRIMEDIEHYNIPIYNFPYDIEEDDEDTIEENSELRNLLPFSIIGSDEEIIVNGRPVRGRQYPWGAVEIDNPRHSDFGRLKSALLSSHLQDLKEITHDFLYENYRTEKLSRTVEGDDDMSLNAEDMASQSVRLKEEQLKKDEEKLRDIEFKVQREIQEKRAELLNKEEALRSLEAKLSQAQSQTV
ncbi:hypothetical protein G6F57_010971 [Rhizopus arrhizus]|uniref:Septin-type G domain-containing protein n=1 Tax=Rhizopus oryzae TaxID=64495 RepID=A0A9P7BNB7_RHIOR|nr:hypothetical protein G6F23_007146 [Rhizopus arrhizus]KAG1411250.1 hypothetical protein G6F58_008658 [Rhizopus delemar]KAG0757294.1 hypothetical protein G6F24_010579 [Rhizopus arrhizus]KAG0787288.1 hypothetical protein G6F21_008006 [Rhizopus arrhizus]KAG0806621.1 hypothetical protein G6F20_010989 [Rhizopus arrhizus]